MNRFISILFVLSALWGCEEAIQLKTPEMEVDARNTVLEYLAKNNLPSENLVYISSAVKPGTDFSYLYTGGERCIEFIVLCHGQSCKELRKYPYDVHGEQCP